MNMLELNHIRSNQATPGGYVVLTLGLLALLMTLVWQQKILAENDMLQARLTLRADQLRQKVSAAEVVMHKPESAAAQQAILHIILPWSGLLKGMESIHRDDIRLMSLDPQWKRKLIQLRLLATNREAIWAYMEGLRQLGMMKEVKLKSSESTHLNGMPVVAFEVEALWDI